MRPPGSWTVASSPIGPAKARCLKPHVRNGHTAWAKRSAVDAEEESAASTRLCPWANGTSDHLPLPSMVTSVPRPRMPAALWRQGGTLARAQRTAEAGFACNQLQSRASGCTMVVVKVSIRSTPCERPWTCRSSAAALGGVTPAARPALALLQSVAAHAVVQAAHADAEQFGGALAVMITLVERSQDRRLLGRLDGRTE